MRIFNYKLISGAALALALPLAVSCNDDKNEPEDENLLPADTYPVEYTATLGGYSGADGGGQFDGTEKIYVESAVLNASGANWGASHSSRYDINNSGKLTTSTPAYWSRKDEARLAQAFVYPKESAETAPASLSNPDHCKWEVAKDQSGNLAGKDFMYASARAAYGKAAVLDFHHQLARVEFCFEHTQIKDLKIDLSSARIGGEGIALSGAFVSPAEGEKYVKWTPEETNTGKIIPFVKDNTVSALLIPQNTGHKDILTVQWGGTERSCAVQDLETLAPGHHYTLKAWVDISDGNLHARLINVNPWTDGESTDVDSDLSTNDYGPVKVGDYYYDDGSWSDGGFISYSTDNFGSIKWTSPKPAPVLVNPITGEKRSVVGIVYSTDLSRMGDAEKEDLRSKGIRNPHGLVMSSFMVDMFQWDTKSHDERSIGIPFTKGSAEQPLYGLLNPQTSGLAVCKAIREKRVDDLLSGQYPLLAAVDEFKKPQNSTGWYVPSAAQWFDILRNLTGLDFTDKCDFYFTKNEYYGDDGLHFDWQLDFNLALIGKYGNLNYADRLNFALSEISSGQKAEFGRQDNLITSSMCDETKMYYIGMMAGKFVTCHALNKDQWLYTRLVLAF